MKKLFVMASIFAVAVISFRRFGPALAKRAMAKCEELMRARTRPEESAAQVAV
jgi:hypothetical protein